MKIILNILILLLISNYINAQFPQIEEFNNGTTWSYTNGAGRQNYGGAENYATFNLGATPYPNNSTVTITSPVYNFSTCTSNISVSFPLAGIIESNNDFMYFQYFNSGVWNTQSTYTGSYNSTYTYFVPNTTTMFRFILITDCSVNGYKAANPNCSLPGYPTTCLPNPGNCNGVVSVYYYDIARFTIDCATVLPIELVDFNVVQEDCINKLIWTTASEPNNDHFELEKSLDGINFKVLCNIDGSTNSTNTVKYLCYDKNLDKEITYYRLKQVDINTQYSYSNIISINNKCSTEQYDKIVNLLGQEVTEDYRGVKLYIYKDKIIKRLE